MDQSARTWDKVLQLVGGKVEMKNVHSILSNGETPSIVHQQKYINFIDKYRKLVQSIQLQSNELTTYLGVTSQIEG